jgi:uncharacterized protein
VTRRRLDPERGVRCVVDPEGWVRPDLARRLPGRGMWLSAERDVVNRAVARNLFARAAGGQVRVDPRLADEIEDLLIRRMLDALGLARRAGEVVAGFEQVRARLRSGPAGVLLAARDGAADGRRKLRRLAPYVPVVSAFSSAQQGAALGHDSVVHIAVAPGALARRLIVDAERLAGFRPDVIEPAAVPSDAIEPTLMEAMTGSR